MAAALPTNLIQAIRYFADEDVAVEYVAKLRWTDGPVCPQCGGKDHSYLTTRRVWKCRDKSCHKQFSVKVGTIFEDSPIKLGTWLAAIWMVANSKNGVSSHEMGRSLGITQKSAWFMNHRIRLAMQTGSFDKFDGEIEADETFVGGRSKNMHKAVRRVKISGKGARDHRTGVAGQLQRSRNGRPSQVRATVIPNTKQGTLQPLVHETTKRGATLYTDQFWGYAGLGRHYDHQTVDHHAAEYVNGRVHTNGIENFWALLKRGIHGTYVQIAPWHLNRYIDERVFTFNERDLTDLGRFSLVLHRAAGRRLTYAELTARA